MHPSIRMTELRQIKNLVYLTTISNQYFGKSITTDQEHKYDTYREHSFSLQQFPSREMLEPRAYLFVSWTSAEFFTLEFLTLYFLTHGNFTILSFLLQRYLAYLMTCFVTDFHRLLALLNILTATFIWWLLCTRQSKELFLTHHNSCDFRDSYHIAFPFPSHATLKRSSPLLAMKLSLQLISSILLLSKFSLIPLEKASRFVRNDFTKPCSPLPDIAHTFSTFVVESFRTRG